jgi:RNA 2',3'-cyclic 3'-phosphodiesterase
VRAFIAVEVPAVSSDVPFPRPPERHLTLAFLGDVGVERTSELVSAMAEAALPVEPFELVLEGGGAFPDRTRPRVVWIGVGEGRPSLERLHAGLADALSRRGFEVDRRPFAPHVTVMRLRSDRDRPVASTLLGALEGRRLGTTTVRELTLFESRLRSTGAEHVALARVPLGGSG